jgi:predicted DNA-binding transcriptional regulator YafY
MPPLNKAQKLVKILELMTRRGGIRASELMERFDLDARTLRRYLSDLKELDLPLLDDGRGDERTVAIDARWRRSGVQLTLTEVLSLHFGRKLFNFLEGTPFAEDMDGAIERLAPAITRTHADIAKELDKKFLAVPESHKDYREHADVIDDVITSLVYNNPLEARYRKINGAPSRYRLHPFTLATFRQGLYLFALDTAVNQVKSFAIERFIDVQRISSEKFDYPHTWNPEAHLASAFGIIGSTPVDVRIAFSDRVAAYIRERTWHPTQTCHTRGDGRMELRLSVGNTVELRTWILSFGDDAQVVHPPELVSDIAESLKRASARYEAAAVG